MAPNHADRAHVSGPAASVLDETKPPARTSPGATGSGSQFAAQTQEHLAVVLAMIAGLVDAYGIMTYGIYLSFMSGNTTQTGYRTGQGNFAAAAPAALAIAFFVGGSFAGAWLADAVGRRARQLVFGVVAASLASIIGFMEFSLSYGAIHIATISVAMGLMNTALARVGALSVSLTFVTGTLSKLAQHLALAARRAPLSDSQGSWDTHVHRALLLAEVWGAFLAGALLSGVATPHLGARVLLLPTLVLLTLAALDLTVSAEMDRRKQAIVEPNERERAS